MNGATICHKKRVKERWMEHFENVLNQDSVAGKDIDENKKFVIHLGCEGRFVL